MALRSGGCRHSNIRADNVLITLKVLEAINLVVSGIHEDGEEARVLTAPMQSHTRESRRTLHRVLATRL